MLVKYILLSILLIHFFPPLISQNFETQLKSATQAYQTGQYNKAIGIYEGILDAGYFSADLYYNLGNAYFKNNQLGPSILTYERGLLFKPYDKDLLYNLSIANHAQLNDISPVSPFFLAQYWRSIRDVFSPTIWCFWGLFFLWTGIFGWTIWIIGKTRTNKFRGFLLGTLLVPFSILPFGLALDRYNHQYHNTYGIIMEPSVSLKEAPDIDSPSVITLFEGLKVQKLDKIEDWIKVIMTDGEVGWVQETAITML